MPGDYSLSELSAILEARGLRSRASRKIAAKPLDVNRLSALLNNDFYVGVIRYAGGVYPGRHDTLIDDALFRKVQDLLASRRQAGDRSWRHYHYLRGSLICADCGHRVFFTRAKGRRGGLYDYFVCGGRSAGFCKQPYHRAEAVEYAIERHYATIELTDTQRERIRTVVTEHLDALSKTAEKETTRARAEVTRLDNEERKLLTMHYNDAISPHIYTDEQQRISNQRRAAEDLLRRYQLNETQTADALDKALELTDSIQLAYLNADPIERRLLNQAFFEHFEIDTEEITGDQLTPPFAQIHALAALTDPSSDAAPGKKKTPGPTKKAGGGGGSYLPVLVD